VKASQQKKKEIQWSISITPPPKNMVLVFRDNLFQDKVALVTGGGTGIGRAIAEHLLALGASVVIASRKEKILEQAVQEMNAKFAGNRASFIRCSIRDEVEVQKMMQFVMDKHGKIDYLVNNGGGQFPARAESISKRGWDAVIETNLTGTFLCCKEAYK
jgi:peroxisomal trans-2-enoyl-CoA reductase